ncbi:MAG TPA: peroxidase family protein [Thermoanaerobaculia bacterium]
MNVSRSTALAAALLVAALPAFAAEPPSTRTLPKGPFRAIDGSGNNVAHPKWGAAPSLLIQNVPMAYGDSISKMGGANRPNPRLISNIVVAQPDVPSQPYASNYLWMWGQFMDHDLDLTNPQTLSAAPFCSEEADIPVPAGDSTFDPNNTGTGVIVFCRNSFDPTTGTDTHNERVQTNVITSFVDASNVYGSDPQRARDLRKLDGSGELRAIDGPGHEEYLPHNINNLPNAIPGKDHHICGDARCEENTNLFSMHTTWMREHNYWARKIRTESKRPLTDEEIYQRARMIVSAEIEAITYNEFLPVLIGPNAIPPYTGYKANVNPGISTVFSTASYRMGHTLLTHVLMRLDSNLHPIPGGDLTLKEAFFNPKKVFDGGGIEPILRGAAHQHANAFDPFIVDDVRNFLINDPQPGAFDLASLNIQRGRDHGLPDYNTIRVAYGLAPKATIADVNPGNLEITRRLSAAYSDVNEIDPWVGGISEAPFPGAVVGELVRTVIAEQFTRSRDGDRFFYLNTFPPNWVNYFNNLHFSDVILRNTTIGKKEIQKNVFLAQ